ncbi:FemAB family XrtA/PEP-CTERM system-associated protein [Qipengyuania soli]|uniref:FemAB family PEP-CTERM system-associated protein n=1 Tax=Qipengyuania soli TaxID=2782568 RepID=A0A7S8F6K6_9SPHN|nr:FemAB family XrtA/PEP-CTERM system-associated protein [Qipengyuania soli]QPD00135.1 FemAB family PEP-CTERM system-associated protein [Qipengyuania soli]
MNAPMSHSATIRLADLSDAGEVTRIEGFVADAGGSVFHRPLWLSAIERGTGNRAHGLLIERGGVIAGWLPLSAVSSPIFGKALVSSGFGVGGGVLVGRQDDAVRLCRAAEELAGRMSVGTVELRGADAPDDWEVIGGRHANFAADLAADDEAQLLAIPRKARAEVRKGLENDLQVSVGSGEDDRRAHFAAYSESVRNLGTPVFPRSLFDAVLDLFGEDADILTVRHGDTPVASVLSLYHRGTVMPFWGGGPFAARSLRANERMYYELMCHARRKGCTRFDFGRSKTASGPFSFKKNWGFEPEPLVYRSWSGGGVAARNIDPTDEGNSAKIEIWKKLPLPIANMIGPWIARGLG